MSTCFGRPVAPCPANGWSLGGLATEWRVRLADSVKAAPMLGDTGKMHGPERERSCFCPDDCNCHHPWRMNYCGCKGH